MRYIMVTHFSDHWDKCTNGKTSYQKKMLRNGINFSNLVENTETIFIKINQETKHVEKVWDGYVSNFDKNDSTDKINFKVHIKNEIQCPEKYKKYSPGWYKEDNSINKNNQFNIFDPPFFPQLNSNNFEEFEDNVYLLLKLIGIHNIHKYDKNSQAGKSDGFFKFANTAVLYDATINSNFVEYKHDQIRNFSSQLKEKNEFEFGKHSYTVTNCNKYVWIITRNKSSNYTQNLDGIIIKEVTINSLINLFHERLESSELTELQLEDKLRKI